MILSAAALPAAVSVPAMAQERPPEQVAVESRIVPRVSFIGEENALPTLEERRAELGVNSASVAIFRGGELDWSQTYGEGVDGDTLYQAASLSKAVASAGIVAIAVERGMSLDADISEDLVGLDLALINPEGLPITLRGLLSHTNGAGVGGFPGYATGTPLPTTAQVIEGSEPTNTDTVVISSERMGDFHYSGGGYTIAQYWAERVTGEDFPALMQRHVLDPVGMERSLFAALPPEGFPRENVARAYYRGDAGVEGGWHSYPEYAAASLWSTPREYGRFALAMIAALEGDGSLGIDPQVAREMLTPVSDDYGLGVGIGSTAGGGARFGHSGSNVGYKTQFFAWPASGNVVVYMSNAQNGYALLSDISRTVEWTYGWGAPEQVVRSRLPASDSERAALIGTYRMAGGEGPTVMISAAANGELRGSMPNGYSFRLIRTGNATWIDPDDGEEVTFSIAEDGTTSVSSGSTVVVRQ